MIFLGAMAAALAVAASPAPAKRVANAMADLSAPTPDSGPDSRSGPMDTTEATAKGAAPGPRAAPPPALSEASTDPSWVRVGVIVASRRGLPEDKPLRYAYQDGEKLERLLSTVGHVEAANLFLLKSERREDLRNEVAKAGERVAALKRAGRKVFLQFYYTGHGAAKNFHFSDGPLGFEDVKEALGGLKADARVYVLDVCYGASFFTAKGFKTAPPVQLQMEMDKGAKGEVTISSSAGDEQAYEVRSLGGSIFTSHWIMALRGAGDRNRDGQVTLFEAYNYAYDRTSGYSAETLARPQHPSFQIDLTGARDVTLARQLRSSSGLLFRGCPPGNYNVLDLGRGHQIGELRVPDGEEFTLALEKGRYRVQYLPAKGKALSADVELPASGMTPLAFAAFAPVTSGPGQGKGPEGRFSGRDPGEAFDPDYDRTPRYREFPGETRFRLTGGMGLGGYRDAKFDATLRERTPTDATFSLGGDFDAAPLRQTFAFGAEFSPWSLWSLGARIETSLSSRAREATGVEPLSSLPDSARGAYPVNLRQSWSADDFDLVFHAGRSFRLGSRQALTVQAGAGTVSRTLEMKRSVERTLYGTTTESSRLLRADGHRLEASLGWWLFSGGNPQDLSPAAFGFGVVLTPWYKSSRETEPSPGSQAVASEEVGLHLGLTAAIGRRRPAPPRSP
jgi:hypothetical protein